MKANRAYLQIVLIDAISAGTKPLEPLVAIKLSWTVAIGRGKTGIADDLSSGF
jgi:hypothetical protein